MHVDAEASEAYRRTGHPGFAVASVGSTRLVVVLGSCHSQYEELVEAHQWQREALEEHPQASQHRQPGQPRSRCQMVRVHSDMPMRRSVPSH